MSHLEFKQAEADNKQSQAIVPWQELQHAGIPTDYKRFEQLWQAEGEQGPLHKVVDQFNGQGLVVKTMAQDEPMQGQQKDQGEVSKMAKRATQKARKKN